MFQNLKVDNVIFENVNGIEASQFLYNSSNNFELEGNLDFNKLTHISNVFLTSGIINNIYIKREWVDIHNVTGETI